MGEVRVPADRYWGAQTQRSFENFRIGTEKMPPEVIRAFAVVKLAAARANAQLGVLDARRADAIETACHEILDGSLDGNFPLAVWQTGSGTQTNMNVNEAIAHGETGRLVDFFDTSALAAEVCALLDDPAARQRLGHNARAFAQAHYDLHRVCLPRQLQWVQDLAAG